ncbi:MAG: outer membrane beta-barrel protein [Muribaculaceae bacterium]|jgi:hypothetical protein|nr:outer membrane beta-barrel protein [Muribaculaceae bacterium]
MKKLLLILAAVAGLSFGANARGTELQIGYGGYTQMDATDMHGGYGKVKTAWGALTAGINFKVLPNLWIGPSYTFSSSEFKHADANLYYHVIMLNGRYAYYRTNIFKMYAHVGVGADITHITGDDFDAENKGYFAFQVSPLCFEAGVGSGVSLFGELGFGAQGLLNVGVRIGL